MTTPGLPAADNSLGELPPLPDDVPALRLGVPESDIRAASRAISALTGWPIDELLGRSVGVLWAPAEREAISRRFEEVVLLGRDSFGALAVSPDGEPVAWVDVEAQYDYRGGQRIEVALRPTERPIDRATCEEHDTEAPSAAGADTPSADDHISHGRVPFIDPFIDLGPALVPALAGPASSPSDEGVPDDDRAVALVIAAMGTAGVPALAVTAQGSIASATSEVEVLVGAPIARLRGRQFEGLFRLSDTAADALSVARAGRMRQTVLANLADGDVKVVLEWVPGYTAGAGIGVLARQDADSGEAERQRLQTRLVSFVAHDVRESLAAVYCGLRTLDAEIPVGAPLRTTLDKTLAESARANRIVDDVLAVSRPGRLTRIELDLAALLRETLDRYRQRAASNHVAIVERLPGGIAVLADLGSLERGFGNLFENALQATPPNGKLTVTVTLEDRGRPGVRISVADTGVGIKADILPNVFEPFVTNKPQGTGLGLPIARRVVLDHEGQIDCESEEGKGTTFHVWLPRVE